LLTENLTDFQSFKNLLMSIWKTNQIEVTIARPNAQSVLIWNLEKNSWSTRLV
jgi:hypothetical protein